jgi:hypothetical protein
MSKHLRAAAALAVAAFAVAPTTALAQTGPAAADAPRDLGYVKDKPALTLDPATSYIIVRTSGAASFAFIRIADEADLADYKARRAAALAKAHGKWERKHASWVKDLAEYKKSQGSGMAIRPPGPEPVEPNDANLAFTPIDVENLISFGPMNRFAKGETSTYMYGVRPGRYAFYGPVMAAPNGVYAGTCMCMGSFEFEVKRGQIVDAGTMKQMLPDERDRAKAAGKELPKTAIDLPEGMTSTGWAPPVAGDKIDPRLANYTVVPADLHASRRVPNYLGLEIDRLMPIDGVIAYNRDKIVDVKTGTTLP